jgi:hypothetical protein
LFDPSPSGATKGARSFERDKPPRESAANEYCEKIIMVKKNFVIGFVSAVVLAAFLSLSGVWAYAGVYGLHVLLRHGGTYWINVGVDSARLSPAMRLALANEPHATPGEFQWRTVDQGFEVADLPVVANGETVDRILLARIDPSRFRFAVYNASDGDKGLDQWMAKLGAALVVNGSYFAKDGRPDTPLVSEGVFLGPKDYDAKAGAFVASSGFTGIRSLAESNWRAAVGDAENAMVSYPMLLADGSTHVPRPSRWLANRSFVGQTSTGQVNIGTTTDAFFSLDRLAKFLLEAPLELKLALNLDGGPVASQAVSFNGYDRRSYGRWEAQVEGDRVRLLTWPFGTVAMPVVLAVFPKAK